MRHQNESFSRCVKGECVVVRTPRFDQERQHKNTTPHHEGDVQARDAAIRPVADDETGHKADDQRLEVRVHHVRQRKNHETAEKKHCRLRAHVGVPHRPYLQLSSRGQRTSTIQRMHARAHQANGGHRFQLFQSIDEANQPTNQPTNQAAS